MKERKKKDVTINLLRFEMNNFKIIKKKKTEKHT